MKMRNENISGSIDEATIEKLCSATWKPLYTFIYYKVQNKEEAEDIIQETYIKTIKYMQKNTVDMDRIERFLRVVSLNVIRDRWRWEKRHGTTINIEDINLTSTYTYDDASNMERREIIENALNKLNEEQRRVNKLRILKGYSVSDTAKAMNKKEGNIRVLQHRALSNLRDILKEEF